MPAKSYSKSYSNFDLLLTETDGGYEVRVVDSPAGQASHTFSLPFSTPELEVFILKIGQNRGSIRSLNLENIDISSVKKLGGALYDCLFSGDVAERFRTSLAVTEREGKGLRIRLFLSGAPSLINIPWELLYDTTNKDYVGLSVNTPVIRKLDLAKQPSIRQTTGVLRVLVMISSPANHYPLKVEQEWDRINTATQSLQADGRLILERVEPSLSALQRALRRNEYHVFHYIGHGGFSNQDNDGVLVLEDKEKKGHLVSGQYLGALLHDETTLQLVLLNSCSGGRTSVTDPFAGVGQSLLQKGIPAVIAMQFEITDEAAITFSHEFYAALADGYPIDAAVAEARKMIYAEANQLEWATPVLYTSLESGTLLEKPTPEDIRLYKEQAQKRLSQQKKNDYVDMLRGFGERLVIRGAAELSQESTPLSVLEAGINTSNNYVKNLFSGFFEKTKPPNKDIESTAKEIRGDQKKPETQEENKSFDAVIVDKEAKLSDATTTDKGELSDATAIDKEELSDAAAIDKKAKLSDAIVTAKAVKLFDAKNLTVAEKTEIGDLSTPRWARESGIDEYGRYADLDIKGIIQRFRWIDAGTFWMGSPGTEVDREAFLMGKEVRHQVILSQGFWLADTTVTQLFWKTVLGNNPASFKDDESNPVERVSWNDVYEFIQTLKSINSDLNIRLPTEAEWEYACRAGTTGPFSFGNNISTEQVNYNGKNPYADGDKGVYRKKTVPVKSMLANSWGLYGMHGNVWEWCQDVWQKKLSCNVVTNPESNVGYFHVGSILRVVRGGSWYSDGKYTRSAVRISQQPTERSDAIGFRLVIINAEIIL
ncbi:MAG: SUMF1/EgtB/PvdO family nonheme iron enzyme [Thiothrix sp.]|uniref:SUMF1/EgtB/PvdO family nonheme iron enzyme n=1 Tax=Thiothrix sp. TaxID=1032 RepID=UPI00260AD01B|nr:SUMF1/EgtB/PvdO family nonheme iron enzyme [Thiothrix sp.]MDD5393937.1 SUMF1/EgtB/PvdO family nonheme iron enzyme [Thiothrix sp.]